MRSVPAFRLSPTDSARLRQVLGDTGPGSRRPRYLLLAVVLIAIATVAGIVLWRAI